MCSLVGISKYVCCRWVECLVVVAGLCLFGFFFVRIVM